MKNISQDLFTNKKAFKHRKYKQGGFFMKGFMIKGFLLFLAVILGYRMRYRLINMALGQPFIRRFVVGSAMSFPGLRSKMMDELI